MEREEKLELERRGEEEMRQENEKKKLEMEHLWVQLMREGKVSIGSAAEIGGSLGVAPGNFDVAANLPLFNERDPDTFFTLFERVADARNWPDCDRIPMLHEVLSKSACPNCEGSRSILGCVW